MKFFFDRSGTLNSAIAQLQAGMDKLSLEENFQGFSYEGTIPANSEVVVPNRMPRGLIPTGFLLTMAEGVNTVVKGDADWTEARLSLKNFHATIDALVTVFFYR